MDMVQIGTINDDYHLWVKALKDFYAYDTAAKPTYYAKLTQSSTTFANEGANWVRAQQDDALAFNTGRPPTRLGLPLELYHEVFGQFKKDIRNDYLLREVKSDLASLASWVSNDLCESMSNIFEKEMDRAMAFHNAIRPLWNFFHQYDLSSTNVFHGGRVDMALLIESTPSNNRNVRRIIPAMAEIKCEPGACGDSQQQITRGYDMSVKQTREKNPNSEWAHAGFPMFLLAVEGKCRL
jgi:hypothetical protein